MVAILDKSRTGRADSPDGDRVRVVKVYLLDGTVGDSARSWVSVVHFAESKSHRLFVRDDRGYRRIAQAFALSLLQRQDQQSLLAILRGSGNGGAFAGSEKKYILREQVAQATDQPQVDETELEAEKHPGYPAAECSNLLVSDEIFTAGNAKGIAWTLFKDHGNALATNSSGAGVAESLVRIAYARGWSSIRVYGSETFRHAVWLEATIRGMQVKGYIPSGLMTIKSGKGSSSKEEAPRLKDRATGATTPRHHEWVYRERVRDAEAYESLFMAYERAVIMARIYQNLSRQIEDDESAFTQMKAEAGLERQLIMQSGVWGI